MKWYWLDSSAIIWANRILFPVEKVRGYWNWLETKLQDGSVVTHKRIFKEVVKGADGDKPDPVAVWTKSRKGIWCSYGDTEESYALVGQISSFCIQKYGFATAKAFLQGADPFLIARAAVDGGVVVTQESTRKEPRIPVICREFNVEQVPLHTMNITLDMTF